MLQWWEVPGSSTWTAMGRTNTWGPILVDETMGCSPTTDRSRETWEDIRDGSTKPCANTMIDVHMVGSHASQNKVGFQLTLPAKLHHLSFIFDLYLVNPKPLYFIVRHLPRTWLGVSPLQTKPWHISFYLTLRQDHIISRSFLNFVSPSRTFEHIIPHLANLKKNCPIFILLTTRNL